MRERVIRIVLIGILLGAFLVSLAYRNERIEQIMRE